MANSMNRTVSAQETSILDESSQMDSKYECAICIYWLNEPVLTSCGHRFCKKCITSWLTKPNPCCPIDNNPLSSENIFPDNFTRREIQQLRKPCPHAASGCVVSVSPLEMDQHVLECEFQNRTYTYVCSFKTTGCKFEANAQHTIELHEKQEQATHLNLLMAAFHKSNTLMKSIETEKLWDAPSKQQATNGGGGAAAPTEDLLQALYERIVVLEQRTREQDLKIDQMRDQLSKCCKISDAQARFSNGVLLWNVTQFQSKVNAMGANPNIMFYSGESYTSAFGYKFCARINISPKAKDFIGLHVHMMQSDNDYHLDWPFRGRIRISLIHKNINESQNDTIMSKPEILAFHRPTVDISPRGFGFLEYACVSDVMRRGFVVNDTLTIKVQMNIV